MHRYIITRLLLAIPTLAGAAALVFVLMRLVPGGVCVIRLGSGGAPVDQAWLQLCGTQLGLDQSMAGHFLLFLRHCAGFVFGISMWSGNPVWQEIAVRLPV